MGDKLGWLEVLYRWKVEALRESWITVEWLVGLEEVFEGLRAYGLVVVFVAL